ncbi:transcription factor Mbp1p [Trichomonascus vanleenenianus]|uniref:transcription factor Mbp1p n=1 Tax=Trichomonascus vanleenenianus TaxID=2268995 RepID=UPI003EC9631C
MATQVYKATYSGVPVYEFPCKNVAVMRRMSDGWVNATHILKVANFDKPQRTRILEREVQKGIHEKVQGGYGKYQGTWVPLDRAREIAEQYSVADLLDALFSYVPTANSPPPAPRQASKAKSVRTASAMDDSSEPLAKRPRKLAAKATKSEPKRRGRPPNSQKLLTSSQSTILASAREQVGTPTTVVDDDDEDDNNNNGAGGDMSDTASISSGSSSEFMSDADLDAALNGKSSQRDDYSSVALSMQNRQFLDNDMIAAEYSNKLLDYFIAPDDDHIPDFLVHPPQGFKINQVIDDEGHTAFHWACAMGILKIIEVLMNIGADINAVNLAGQTPLIRAIMFTNNFDRRTFPRVVELLRDTIFYTDRNRQTILHHIAATTLSRSKLSSTRYYTEIILAKLSETHPMHELTSFLDRQDTNGDTALHIAARNGARKCVKVLLSYHASIDIPNHEGYCAYHYMAQDPQIRRFLEGLPNYHQIMRAAGFGKLNRSHSSHINNTSSRQVAANGTHETYPATIQQAAAAGYDQGGYGNGFFGHPHTSETAIKVSQQVASFMNEQLEVLASAYDDELREKDRDLEQVHRMLREMKEDISAINKSIVEQEKQIGSEVEVERQLEDAQLKKRSKLAQLRKLVERSQARDLAEMVQREESLVQDELMNNSSMYSVSETTELARELKALQVERKELVDEITMLNAEAGVGDKMNEYRRLVALSCGVKIDEIDELLDSIAEALSDTQEDERESGEPRRNAGKSKLPAAPTTPTRTKADNSSNGPNGWVNGGVSATPIAANM